MFYDDMEDNIKYFMGRLFLLTNNTDNTETPNLQGGPKKKLAPSNINRFSKFFHSPNQEEICNITIAKDPTTPQVCRYTTL